MSINAELVAKDVLATVRKGQKVNMGKIIRSHGYSEQVAKTIKPVTRTKSYQAIMIPALQRMENIRNKVLKALENKDMNLEDARVLKELLDSTTKNIQLLSGKPTDNVASTINIVRYDDVPETPPSTVLGMPQIPEPVKNTVIDEPSSECVSEAQHAEGVLVGEDEDDRVQDNDLTEL